MKKSSTKQLVLTALFSAIICVGTFLFKIPVGNSMVHMGNALVVIAFLILNTRYSMIAAAIGFGIFDILSGYASVVYITILESIIVILGISFIYHYILKNQDTFINITLLGISAGIIKILIIFIRKLITNSFLLQNNALPSNRPSVLIYTLATMSNTFITAVVTAVAVPIFYFLIKNTLLKNKII